MKKIYFIKFKYFYPDNNSNHNNISYDKSEIFEINFDACLNQEMLKIMINNKLQLQVTEILSITLL
jgi:hypothetical protein